MHTRSDSPPYHSLTSDGVEEKQQKKPNAFVRAARRIYNPLGFKKGYNFILGFIFAGALLGFCLWNIRVVDVNGYWAKDSPPGEWYYFRLPRYNIGMQLHLCAIIPAGILVFFQFIPIIRYKALIVHRLNGWTVVLLLLVANAGALMIANRSFGGLYDTQVMAGMLAISTTFSAVMGVINIKLKQIDQHRKWMIRCWVYAFSIITLRFGQMAAVQVVSRMGGFYIQMSCGQIAYMEGNIPFYPSCTAGGDTAFTAVEANIYTQVGVEEAAAAYQMAFGQAGTIALILHAVLVEVYFHLTPAESERLRAVSYEKKLELGFRKPGSGGLTSDRLGDAPRWRPATASR
ncbi:hypothetical protein LTR37_011500 [Vermiconidia calcicola]|uniref:Uncharacterized protein n=1 Tax=Vermiconidia calcicola TaxID=1690605 RepID=A0ACC3N2I7_9PEZI|nr:hypothetical protein LTR37_011500 [Vermiconidia calcicola]